MLKIEIENNVFCCIKDATKKEANVIWDALSYDVELYLKKSEKQAKHIQSKASFFNKKTKVFYVGFLKKIKKTLRNNNIDYRVIPKEKKSKLPKLKSLSGTEERKYQTRSLKKLLKAKRAIFDSKTGSGKTVIFNRIIKTIGKRTLILCSKKDVHTQNIKVSQKYFKDIGVIKSQKDLSWKGKDIVFATPQTMSKIDPIEYIDYFDVLIYDECHLIAKTHEDIISTCNAEYRFAFTGTVPSGFKKLQLIGLFGDIITGIKDEEAKDFLSDIKVQLKNSPYKQYSPDDRYQQVYDSCVINNQPRNEMIIGDAIELIEQGLSGLIMTTQYQHGHNLNKIASEAGYDLPYISGKTSEQDRDFYKKEIDNKNIPCIISNIWKEGLDIESLNFIIIAFGHKAEDRLRQMVGRVIRKHESKEYGLILDYIDKQKWLGSHSIERISTYVKNGWL